MRFIVLHPSFGRPERGVAAANQVWERFSGSNQLAYHIGLQSNDPQHRAYTAMDADPRIQFSLNQGPDQVGNLNSLYQALGQQERGTVLIYNSDDTEFPCHWDTQLQEAIEAHPLQASGRFAVMVSDGHRSSEDPLQIVCIASAGYLNEKGYFHHPDYIHLYGDTEFTMAAYRDSCVIEARHIVIRHLHYTYGLAAEDETYRRGNSERLLKRDRAVYNRRARQGFPPRTRRFWLR